MNVNQEENANIGNGVPAELKKWNWGAFLLTWIWGLKHKVWISLLVFVPIVNLVIWVLLGLKGNEWAWKRSGKEDVSAFLARQKKWGIAGWIVIPLFFIVGALLPTTEEKSAVDEALSEVPVENAKKNLFEKSYERTSTPSKYDYASLEEFGSIAQGESKYLQYMDERITITGVGEYFETRTEYTNDETPSIIMVAPGGPDNSTEMARALHDYLPHRVLVFFLPKKERSKIPKGMRKGIFTLTGVSGIADKKLSEQGGAGYIVITPFKEWDTEVLYIKELRSEGEE